MRTLLLGLVAVALAGCKDDPPHLRPEPPKASADPKAPKGSSSVPPASSTATVVPSAGPKPTIAQLTVGHTRACALATDGRVACFGKFLGSGDDAGTAAPRWVDGVTDAIEIGGSDGTWCARRKSGELVCWSELDPPKKAAPIGIPNVARLTKYVAFLSNGAVVELSDPPKPVPGLTDVVAISHDATSAHCAIQKGGDVYCWGTDTYGQLADGATTDRLTPVKVPALKGADEIAISFFFGGCARFGKKVKCWGGEGNVGGKPAEVAGITDAVELDVEEYHACVRLSDGGVACWGNNSSGQSGAPPSPDNPEVDKPQRLDGAKDAVSIALGGGEPCGGCGTTCYITSAGVARCRGQVTPTGIDDGPTWNDVVLPP